MEGALNGTRKEAYTGADREFAAQIEVAVANGKTTAQASKDT
jgi:hypothetical protein